MISYLTNLTELQAEAISRAIYELSIGDKINTYTTQYALPIIKHPERDEWALKFDDEQSLPIILNNNTDKSRDNLRTLFSADLEENESLAFGNYIKEKKEKIDKKDQRVWLKDILPKKTKLKLKTYEQLEADGWFPQTGEV